jgi:CAAX protease family protein
MADHSAARPEQFCRDRANHLDDQLIVVYPALIHAEIVSSLDMPDSSQNGLPPVSAAARTPKTWDFMETLFVALVAYAVYGVTSWLAYAALVAMHDAAELSPAALRRSFVAASIIGCPPTIAVLWIAVRMAGRELSEYLDLNWPRRNELIEALIMIAVLWILERATTSALEPVNLSEAYGGAGGIFLFFVFLTITGPIVEEFLCRGFMFRGWSQSFLRPAGAIVLISVIWTATHADQGWWACVWIFVFGLVLGYFRWRSRSTWLAVLCHSAINVLVFFTFGRQV